MTSRQDREGREEPSGPRRLSTASHVALLLAEEEGRNAGSKDAQPAHLFIALCKLCDLDSRELFDARRIKGSWLAAEEEIRRVRAVFEAARLEPKAFRRRLRAVMGYAENFSRLASVDQDYGGLLERADRLRGETGDGRTRLVHLLAALAERRWAPWLSVLSELKVRREDLLEHFSS